MPADGRWDFNLAFKGFKVINIYITIKEEKYIQSLKCINIKTLTDLIAIMYRWQTFA
jgi:hypothetical protein